MISFFLLFFKITETAELFSSIVFTARAMSLDCKEKSDEPMNVENAIE